MTHQEFKKATERCHEFYKAQAALDALSTLATDLANRDDWRVTVSFSGDCEKRFTLVDAQCPEKGAFEKRLVEDAIRELILNRASELKRFMDRL